MSYVTIPTTSDAQREVRTRIEADRDVLLIRKGSRECLYTVREFPTAWAGRAFALLNETNGERYNVFLADNGQDSTCDCPGFTYTSNHPNGGRCKHLDAIKHLVVP